MGVAKGVLTVKQRAFAENYVLSYNATEAYQKAYPDASYHTAKSKAYKLLKHEGILEYIQELQKEQWKAACINAERIGKELARIAFNESGDVCYKDQLKALELLSKQIGLYTQKVEVKQEIIEVGIENEDSIEEKSI